MADQEFLVSFAVDIDEAGVSRLQSILTENRELADSLASAFGAASNAIHSFAEELGLLPDFSGRGIVTEGLFGSGGLSIGLNLSQAFTDYESFTALVKQPISLNANAAGIVSAARSAMNSVRSIFSSPVTIRVKAEQDGGDRGIVSDTPVRMSAGGRFSRPTDVQVAEDGDAEYIIPVKKEGRALPLLRQLLGELSPAARENLGIAELGMKNMELSPGVTERAGTVLSASPAAGNAVAGGITQTTQTVSAPVNIQVHSSGTNAEQVGQRIYDTAERYLLRTLKGALA